MCKVYNSVGCLTTVKTHLKQHNINEFNSINEVINFQQNFSIFKQQINSKHEQLIKNEKIKLDVEILELTNSINTNKTHLENSFRSEIEELTKVLSNLSTLNGLNFFQRLINFIKRWSLKKKLKGLKLNLDKKVNSAVSNLVDQHQSKTNRYQFITSQFKEAVNESSFTEIKKLENKKEIIDEVKNSIYGALGEHKVVKELENLSDDNILINDFNLSFHPAIYNKQENDYIKSIQIDHLLVTPSGIFIIETKNWSDKSLLSLDLRSPIQQIKRTSFALFNILIAEASDYRINIKKHHWGDRKIPIRNLIVMTNSKPKEEFQYVKVLTIGELLGYVN
jgi:hypothetical protein